jgi:hypothetical protein
MNYPRTMGAPAQRDEWDTLRAAFPALAERAAELVTWPERSALGRHEMRRWQDGQSHVEAMMRRNPARAFAYALAEETILLEEYSSADWMPFADRFLDHHLA